MTKEKSSAPDWAVESIRSLRAAATDMRITVRPIVAQQATTNLRRHQVTSQRHCSEHARGARKAASAASTPMSGSSGPRDDVKPTAKQAEMPPLLEAALAGDENRIRELILAGADVNCRGEVRRLMLIAPFCFTCH